MTKIPDDEIQTRDPRLREVISNLITLWNLGKIGFTQISATPTDTPDDVELRAFKSGATYRLYVYYPSDGWHFVALT